MAVCEDWMADHDSVRGIGYYYEGGCSQADNLVELAKKTIEAGAKGEPFLAKPIAFFDKCQAAARAYGYDTPAHNFFGRISEALRGE